MGSAEWLSPEWRDRQRVRAYGQPIRKVSSPSTQPPSIAWPSTKTTCPLAFSTSSFGVKRAVKPAGNMTEWSGPRGVDLTSGRGRLGFGIVRAN